jgi:hypothetical protein
MLLLTGNYKAAANRSLQLPVQKQQIYVAGIRETVHLWLQYRFTRSTRENSRALIALHFLAANRTFGIAKHASTRTKYNVAKETAADQQEPTGIQIKELLHRAIQSNSNSTRIIVSDLSRYLLADEERIQNRSSKN